MSKYVAFSRLLTVLYLSCSALVAAETYYVSSSSGSDDNNGLSPRSAWKTLERIHEYSPKSGDTIALMRGDVWRETLRIDGNGTSESPVTYTAFGNEQLPNPLILGSEVTSAWESIGNGVYRSLLRVEKSPNHVVLRQGKRTLKMKRRKSITNPSEELQVGEFSTRKVDGGYILFVNHPSLPRSSAEYGVRTHGIHGNGGHVTVEKIDVQITQFANIFVKGNGSPWIIRDLNVRFGWGSNRRTPGAGIEVRQVPYTVIDNVTVKDAHGDGIFVRCRHVTVQNSRIYTVYKGWNPGGDNIQFSSGKTDGFRILNNWMTQEGTDTPKGCIQQEFGDNGIIRGNVVLYGVFGIEFNGNNILVENNLVAFTGYGDRRGDDPFSSAIYMSEHRGYDNITIRENVVLNADISAINLDATNGRKFPPYDRTNINVHNNTILGARYGFRTTVPFSGEVYNNIFQDIRGPVIAIRSIVPNRTLKMDYNIIPAGKETIYRIGNNTYKTLEEVRELTGMDMNTLMGDAGLSVGTPDPIEGTHPGTSLPIPTLESDSPAIDSGIYVGRERGTIRGHGVDRGAIESPHVRGPVPSVPVAPTAFQARALSQDEIYLRWIVDDENSAGVRVYRTSDPDTRPGPESLLIPLTQDSQWFDSKNLGFGESFIYTLVNVSKSGRFSQPLQASATTLDPPEGFLVYEGFQTKTKGDVPLDGFNGGHGFAGPWKAPDLSQLGGGSPKRPGLESLGRIAEIWDGQSRPLAMKLNPAEETLWLGLFLGSTNSSKRTQFHLSDSGESHWSLEVSPGSPMSMSETRGSVSISEDVVFCLVKFEPYDGGVRSTLWIDPDVSEGELLSSPEIEHFDSKPWQFNEIAAWFSHSSDHRGLIDEIRIGKNVENAIRSYVPDTIAPITPTGLQGEFEGTARIRVNWDRNNESDISGYQVFRTSGASEAVAVSGILDVAYFTDTQDLEPGQSYTYHVIAVDTSDNRSKPSSRIQVTLPAPTGTLMVYDGFKGDATDAPSSFGWESGTWIFTDSDESGFRNGSLGIPGVETHAGKISVVGNASREFESLLPLDGEILWMGVVLECRNSGREGTFTLRNGSQPVLSFTHRPTRQLKVNGSATDTRGNKGHQFYLVKFENGEATIWIDPDLLDGEPNEKTAWKKVALKETGATGVQISHYPASLFSTYADEIRIGRQFLDAIQGTR